MIQPALPAALLSLSVLLSGGGDPPELPPVGSAGGPARSLDAYEAERWLAGRALFEREWTREEGLGSPRFNAPSCGTCHHQPVLGGAGGLDANVGAGHYSNWGSGRALSGSRLERSLERARADERGLSQLARLVEGTRQTPSTLGLGLLETIDAAAILAGEDPEDADGDGVRGVAHRITTQGVEEVGRFGWRAQRARLDDFVRTACSGELGLTLPDDGRDFGRMTDGDAAMDPELGWDALDALVFYARELAAPPRAGRAQSSEVLAGERLFESVGCAACHTPSLAGSAGPVPLYSDLLLHEVVGERSRNGERALEQDDPHPGGRSAFRTPPLWGVSHTAPYLHDGRALTLEQAIELHEFEAAGARQRWGELSPSERASLLAFLGDL